MDKQKLRELAEPLVPWCVNHAWEGEKGTAWLGNISYDDNLHEVASFDLTMYDGFEGDSLSMAQYYAAANPATILALLDENAALLEALRGMVQLDREHHQRGDDDIDISYEVQSAYNAIAKAESAP